MVWSVFIHKVKYLFYICTPAVRRKQRAEYKKRKYIIMEKRDRSDRGGRDFGAPREMHDVTCADCGKETQVPFKPDGNRPVYCRDCYQKHRPKRF